MILSGVIALILRFFSAEFDCSAGRDCNPGVEIQSRDSGLSNSQSLDPGILSGFGLDYLNCHVGYGIRVDIFELQVCTIVLWIDLMLMCCKPYRNILV